MMSNRYELLRRVGEGAMGVVWHARDRERGIDVALKTMRPELARFPQAVRGLRAEADLCARTEGPHVVRVLDVSTRPGEAYVAYELLEGETLKERLEREGALDADTTRAIVCQLARALARIHERGVVHRDLKPANVFLVPCDDGGVHVKLLDFGLADDGDHPDDFAGTPDYMAPEVLLGEQRADRAADLYALAVLAHECLTGALPHAGCAFDTLEGRFTADIAPVEAARPELPAAVTPWLRRGLARDPGQRFADAAELAATCARALGA
ncbi:MAG: serine/threonine protein kinase [Myxococcales bacterium]|nr:serine/threonine protein kinase [Myxococcales bacterium]